MISGVASGSNYYEQMAAIQKRNEQRPNPFVENDANGDGSMDIDELKSFTAKMSEMTGKEVNAEELLAKLDADEDGLVSEAEFEAGRPEGPPPPPPPMSDEEAAGRMGGSLGEIQTLLASLGGSEDESEESESDPLDTNGDGIVDAQELKAGLAKIIQNYQEQAGNYASQAGLAGSLFNLET